MAEVGRRDHRVTVYLDVKVGKDGTAARAATRRSLTKRLPWADIQLEALGVTEEVATFIQEHGQEGMAQHMPDEWLDAFSAAGTPEQVFKNIQRLSAVGADSVIFQPLDGDVDCLEEYIRYLIPQLKAADHLPV